MKANLRHGLTKINIDTEKGIHEIIHTGNMGNTLEDVDKNLSKLGFPSLERYRKTNDVVEEGSPDYFYKMTVS